MSTAEPPTIADEKENRNLELEDATQSRSSNLKKKQKHREYLQIFALYVCMFLAGWNDGSIGPLLPRIEQVYNVNYTIVSLLFVLACVGFVSGAVINIPLSPKLGYGKMLALGSVFQIVAYVLQCAALPFPVYLISFTINGVGMAIQDAHANGYIASMENSETKMGLLHAVYGLGALCAPLVSTQFAYLPRWSFHYLCSLGIAILNTILSVAVFRLKDQDSCMAEIGQAPREKSTSQHSEFRQVLGQKTVHLLAFFILVYVGVEVTIGGWIVTFLINERGGGKSAGYVSSGFFGGITLGRVLLIWVNKKVGERRILFIYTVLAIALEFVVWFVPSVIGNAVAVSFIGFFLGPMYPIVMNHTGRILPPWTLTGAIGWIAGFGQAGSALFPFITGALANKVGIMSLQPLLVAMMGFMMILWAVVPNQRVQNWGM